MRSLLGVPDEVLITSSLATRKITLIFHCNKRRLSYVLLKSYMNFRGTKKGLTPFLTLHSKFVTRSIVPYQNTSSTDNVLSRKKLMHIYKKFGVNYNKITRIHLSITVVYFSPNEKCFQ